MEKFKFRLNTFLEVKEIRKKQVQVDFAKVCRHLDSQKQTLKNLECEVTEVTAAITGKIFKGMIAAELKEHSMYLNKMDSTVKSQFKTVAEIQKNKEIMQKTLLKLHKEAEVLDDLKQKQYLAYRRDIWKQEEKIMDEFVVYRARVMGGRNEQGEVE